MEMPEYLPQRPRYKDNGGERQQEMGQQIRRSGWPRMGSDRTGGFRGSRQSTSHMADQQEERDAGGDQYRVGQQDAPSRRRDVYDLGLKKGSRLGSLLRFHRVPLV